jgi:sugar phosphate isomerase/epimerase
MNLQLGASVYGFFAGREQDSWPSLADAARSIRQLDPRLGIEIWAARGPDDAGPSAREEREIIEACAGAPFLSMHARGQYWTWDPAGLRSEIDLAHRLGARTLVVHPESLGLDDASDRPDVPEIRRVLDHARRGGVRVALENTVDSMRALDRALDVAEDDSTFGICIDIGHAALSRDAGRHPVRAYIDRYSSRLIHLHLHDTMGTRDDHTVPGRGRVDWSSVQSVLREAGYSGPAVLEVVPGLDSIGTATPVDLLREAVAFLSTVA